MMQTTDAVTVSPLQNTRLDKNPLNGLRSPGLLGKWPLIGLMMILLGGSLFGVLAVAYKLTARFSRPMHKSSTTCTMLPCAAPP